MKPLIILVFSGLLLSSPPVENRQPEIRIRDLEHRIHDLVNESRKANGREPLRLDEKLSGVARAHSEDMAKNGYFEHIDPAGKTPHQRIAQSGMSCMATGENIYQNNLYTRVTIVNDRKTYDWSSLEQIASTTVKGWMASPGHRQNILDKNYGRSDVGVAIASDSKVYITQNFCN